MNVNEAIQSAFENYQAGNLQQAEIIYKEILNLQPNNLDVIQKLANILQDKGQIDEAIDYYQKAINLKPNDFGFYYNLADAFLEKGEIEQAILNYKETLRINPNFPWAYNNLGLALKGNGQVDEAITHFKKAIELSPNFTEAYTNLGIALDLMGSLSESIRSHAHALLLRPDFVEAYSNLGNAYESQGNLDKAEECYRKALIIKPNCSFCFSNLIFSMNYSSRYDAQTLASEHLRFNKQIIEPLSFETIGYTNERIPSRSLRIGYVSPDFRRHAVAYFIEAVISTHNREHFDVFCYSNSLRHDEVTKRIKEKADQWRNIVGLSDEDVTELIQKDKIDILVDLAGHTADNRMLVFARKPAPIQISWIGYLATTGLSTMDYKIVDSYTDPPGKTEQLYTEKLLRLPESFLCYLPDKDSPEVRPLPALSTGYTTFGSFNKFAKVTSEVFTLWAKILRVLPNSRLILKGKSFYDKPTCQYAINMFIQRGIAAERITLQPSDPSPKHLESYNLVDIGLDTFPFNGAATTCEAMWMGVPVITFAGTAYHARVGVSLLSNVGLPGLVAKTSDEYISTAVNLAKDLKRLQSLREHLRDMMTHSSLCDAKRFTVHLEMCYRKMWQTWCNSV
jgi:protein O-GlcNAc transferase